MLLVEELIVLKVVERIVHIYMIEKGMHAIRLSNAAAPMPNVDCLTIRPVAAGISP